MHSPEIRVVLVAPSHPGNIGAVARAMKNMALSELVLVRPRHFPDAEATARASGADDVLGAARVVGTLAEALHGCGYVAATTSRERDQYFRIVDVREAAARIVAAAQRAPAAVVFGAERTGLTNEELETAHALIRIPANDAYASLNLAMAVQLVAYELFRAHAQPRDHEQPGSRAAGLGREHAAAVRALRAGARGGRFPRPYAKRHASHVAHPPLPAARRTGPQRGEYPARLPHGGAEPPPPRRSAHMSGSAPLYLDYAATTPVDAAVAQVMGECLTLAGTFGNAASAHAFGFAAARRGRGGTRPGGRAAGGRARGDRLHLRCHRVQQPGTAGGDGGAAPSAAGTS